MSTLSPAAVEAIKARLSYLEDNRYRHVHMGGLPVTHPTVVRHDKEIAELKHDLYGAGVKL